MKSTKSLLVFCCSLFWLLPVSAEDIRYDKRADFLKSYPCEKCHADEKMPAKTTLPLGNPHSGIEFNHMKLDGNCALCHSSEDRNYLVNYVTKEKVSFDESYKVCLDCHGEKVKDWELGIHGKQVGSWSGVKYRYTCVECHNPHTPKFPDYVPLAGPAKPESLIEKGE